MRSFKNLLIDQYTLRESIKAYKGYKVKPPEVTIKFIKSAFKEIDLNLAYFPNNNPLLRIFYSFQSGTAFLFPKENNKMNLLQAGGKGVTPKLAVASGFAELIERFTGYGQASGNIWDYLSVMKFGKIWEIQRRKNKLIENEFSFHSIDTLELIPEDKRDNYFNMAKSVCYSLTKNKFFCYPEEFILKLVSSNGLASGNTLEEATLHGIFEVIERLGGMYILDTLPKCNKISTQDITHPTLKKLMNAINSTGVNFVMLDFSHVFNVPMIVTIFDHPKWDLPPSPYTNESFRYPKMVIGVDTDPQDAAIRCFTELLQVTKPIEDSVYEEHETSFRFKLSKICPPLEHHQFLRSSAIREINGNQPTSVDFRKYKKINRNEISILDIKSLYDLNQKIEINRIVENLQRCNIEVFLHNITNPILRFPVVRVMLAGGNGYFSQMPLNGYSWIMLGKKNKKQRYSYLNLVIDRILSPNILYEIIKDEKWGEVADQQKLIEYVISYLFFSGFKSPLWGVPINKFYFLSMLYLRMNKYERARNCLDAALYKNFKDISFLIAMAYVFSKLGMKKNYQDIMDFIQLINVDSTEVRNELKSLEDPIIDPNPFELCDFQCEKRNKPYLCTECFFNYVSENIFLKTCIDDLLMN